jgi:hypothetical protein
MATASQKMMLQQQAESVRARTPHSAVAKLLLEGGLRCT